MLSSISYFSFFFMNSREEKKSLTFNISMKKVLTIVSSIIEDNPKTHIFKKDFVQVVGTCT